MLTHSDDDVALRDRQVLLTGATGFVGANLARRLVDEGARTTVLLRESSDTWRLREVLPKLTVRVADLQRPDALRQALATTRPEIIFHLATARASATVGDRVGTLESNVIGLWNLLEATAGFDCRKFVYISSSLEYGWSQSPLREDSPISPATFFGATKAASTLVCEHFARANRRRIVILRLFSVFGPWESPERLIPKAILAAFRGDRLRLTQAGFRRDFVFVDDVVRAMLLTTRSAGADGQIINVGSGTQTTNEGAIALIEELVGRRIAVDVGDYPPHASDTTHWVADNSKARRVLSWEPQYDLRAGLQKTVDWLRRHQSLYLERLRRGTP